MNAVKKTRRFCCSTCGVEGHNKNNTKFHPDNIPKKAEIKDTDLYTEWIVECDEVVEGDRAGEYYYQQDKGRANLFYNMVVGDSSLKTYGVIHFVAVRLVELTTICNSDRDDYGEEVSKIIHKEWKSSSLPQTSS